MKLLLLTVVMLAVAGSAQAAPEGFRLSAPLTARAVAVGGNPAVTVHCSLTMAIWRSTATTEVEARASGRADRSVDEVELPTTRCGVLERWLKGKTVDMELLAWAMFIYAHEIGHIVLDTPSEPAANCYATRRFNLVARAFGVKRAATLRRLRDEAPLFC